MPPSDKQMGAARALSVQLPKLLSGGPTGAQVGVVFGSASDWPTMKLCVEVLDELGIASEYGVVSAHRTPDRLRDYAQLAVERGLSVIIAGAGGAAHLPGMLAAWTTVPVLGVPIQSRALSGLDSLYSIVQMPKGVPVGTLAIGEAGARNGGLLAARMLSTSDEALRVRLAARSAAEGVAALEATLDAAPHEGLTP